MNHLAASAFGTAAMAALLITSYLGRSTPAPIAVVQAPALAKSDRLPAVRNAVVPAPPPDQPPPKVVVTERIRVAEPAHHVWGVYRSRGRPSIDPNGDSGSDQGKQEGTADDRDSRGRHGPHLSGVDPVCGPRGRTWYTKDNGWRYWRCQR